MKVKVYIYGCLKRFCDLCVMRWYAFDWKAFLLKKHYTLFIYDHSTCSLIIQNLWCLTEVWSLLHLLFVMRWPHCLIIIYYMVSWKVEEKKLTCNPFNIKLFALCCKNIGRQLRQILKCYCRWTDFSFIDLSCNPWIVIWNCLWSGHKYIITF